jgi:PAS domain S-box-containing protein
VNYKQLQHISLILFLLIFALLLYSDYFYQLFVIFAILIYVGYKEFAYQDLLKHNKELEKKVMEKSQEYNHLLTLFDRGNITLFRWRNDKHWSVEYVSNNCLDLTGYSVDEFKRGEVLYASLIEPNDMQQVSDEVAQGVAENLNFFLHKPYRIISKEGQQKWLYDATATVKNKKGKITHFLGYIIDISDIKHQELELQKSKDTLLLAQKHANIGSYRLHLDDNSIEWSHQHYRIMHKEPQTYHPTLEDFMQHIHPDDIQSVQQALASTIKTLQDNDVEYRILFDKHRPIYVHSTIHIDTLDLQGKAKSLTGTIQDITNTKELEIKLQKLNENLQEEITKKTLEGIAKDKLLQEQLKLAAMGEMVGAIAHQWRQPLNSLNIHIQNLDDDYEEGLIDKDFIDTFIQKQSKTIAFMSNTIDDFRNFFRVDKVKKSFSIKKAITNTLSLQQAQLDSHNITTKLLGEDFEVYTIESEFQQILLNLISNAKDAIANHTTQDGTITIALLPNRVEIIDNGGGVPYAIRDRIFEPYFTTKEQGKGTGIGLYMSKMILEQNLGGVLRVENIDGGAKFIIELKEQT